MVNLKRISSTLSLAATVLLQSCSSSETGPGSGLEATPNTSAAELNASWQSDCIMTSSGSTSTTTGSSGGSGSGGVSGGSAYIARASFSQDGRVELSSDNFATSNCNSNTSINVARYSAFYYVGKAGIANDGSQVTEIKFSNASTGSSTFSIFQITNSSALYLGDGASSTPGNDGSSEASRLDGLGIRMSKI